MSVIKMNIKEIIFCISELVIGILLLINPVSFTSGIIVLLGVSMLATGILFGYKYFRMDAEEAKKGNMLTFAILLVMMGAFCILRSDWVIATFPILTVIYGIMMLVAGVSKIQTMVDMLRLHNNKWFWAGINAVVSIICAVVILWSPFTSTAVLWIFAGVSLIVEAVFDIVTLFLAYIGKKVVDEFMEESKEEVHGKINEETEEIKDAEVVDEVLNVENNEKLYFLDKLHILIHC